MKHMVQASTPNPEPFSIIFVVSLIILPGYYPFTQEKTMNPKPWTVQKVNAHRGLRLIRVDRRQGIQWFGP